VEVEPESKDEGVCHCYSHPLRSVRSPLHITVSGPRANPPSASIISVVRIPYIRSLNNKADFLYSTVTLAVLCLVEVGIGIIALSIATLKPMFKVFLERSKLWGSSSARDGSNPRATPDWGRKKNGQYVRSSSKEGAPAPGRGGRIGINSMGKVGVGEQFRFDTEAFNDEEQDYGNNIRLRDDLKRSTGVKTTVTATPYAHSESSTDVVGKAW
jgi:hypothetical protein